MNHTDTAAGLVGLALIAALHAVPEVAFLLQAGAVGAFLGTVIAFRRGLAPEGRALMIYRWTALLTAVAVGAAMIDRLVG